LTNLLLRDSSCCEFQLLVVAKIQVFLLTLISSDATIVKEETWPVVVTCCNLLLMETHAKGSFLSMSLASLTTFTQRTEKIVVDVN
jgi:hypothetical protein